MVSMGLRIDGDRLWDTIQETARWGRYRMVRGGIVCSDEDKAVREWFIKQTEELGCTIKEVDSL